MSRRSATILTLTGWLTRIATLSNACLMVFVAGSAVMRYAFGAPVHFSEELVGVLFLVGVMLALPDASARDEHIKVTLLTDQLRGRKRLIATVVGRLVTLAFVAWLLWLAVGSGAEAFERGLVTEQAGIPVWIAYAVIALSAGTMVIATLTQLAQSGTQPPAQGTTRSLE